MIYRRRQTITIYSRWIMKVGGMVKPIRRVLHNVFWDEAHNTVARLTGAQLANSIFVQCFEESGVKFILPHEWYALPYDELDGLWTADIATATTSPIIVNHETEHEFAFGASGTVTTQENAFAGRTPGAFRVVGIDNNFRGTSRSRHVLLRA